MRSKVTKSASIALCFLALALPTSAQARGLLLFGPQLLILQLGSGSHCIGFTYDANGNRTSQSVSVIGSGSTLWGSGTYGCFVWDN